MIVQPRWGCLNKENCIKTLKGFNNHNPTWNVGNDKQKLCIVVCKFIFYFYNNLIINILYSYFVLLISYLFLIAYKNTPLMSQVETSPILSKLSFTHSWAAILPFSLSIFKNSQSALSLLEAVIPAIISCGLI